ncbi:MAG TPA: DnaJ C-terminal domain-containing protein, partial [Phycicoccus sp.]|nr:DnaJ C-terminal domain-containing protein [Phycicoccus sp.]
TAAALGTTITLDTLDGEREIDVKRGSMPGDTVTLRGLGVTHLRQSTRGDLTVHLLVQTPTKLTAEQEALLRNLAELRGEQHPNGKMASPSEGTIFGKLRDAFKTR